MPALMSPRIRWPAKPEHLAVDWSSPLSDRLIRAYLFQEASGLGPMLDLCGNDPLLGMSATTVTFRDDEDGVVGRSTGTGWNGPDVADTTPGTGNGQGLSVLVGLYKETASVADAIADRYQSASLEWVWGFTSGTLYAWVYDTGVGAYSGRSCAASAVSAAVWHDMAWTWGGQIPPKDSMQLWNDGLRIDTTDFASGTFAQVQKTVTTWGVGRTNVGTGVTTGLRFRYLYLFRRGLLPDEVGTLAENPYALLRDTRRRLPRVQTSSARVGLLIATQGDQALTSTGLVTVTGSTSLTQASHVLTSAGALAGVGTATLTQSDHVLTSTGALPGSGTAILTQDVQALTSTGLVPIVGTATLTQAAHLLSSTGVAAVHTALELIAVDAIFALEAHVASHVTLAETPADVTLALTVHIPDRTTIALITDDVALTLALHAEAHGGLALTTDPAGATLLAHAAAHAALAFTTDAAGMSLMAHIYGTTHGMLGMTTDAVTVVLATHLAPLTASLRWLEAAAHAATLAQTGGQYQPVLLVDFPAFMRRFTTHPMLFGAEEPWLARLTEGGVGAITRDLDELVDTVRLGGSSVVLVNENGFVDTFLQAPFLNTPVEIRLGFVDLDEVDFLLIFPGVVDRYAFTRPRMEFALLDASVKDSVNLNVPINADLFPNAPSESRSKNIPIFIGVHVNAPVIQVSGVAATGTLSFAMDATSPTVVLLETSASFPAASIISLGAESLRYASRSLIAIEGRTYVELSGLTRVSPSAHTIGTVVTLTDLAPSYVIGFGVDAVNAVRLNGTALDASASRVFAVLITGHPVPVVQLLTTPAPGAVVTVDVNALSPQLPFSVPGIGGEGLNLIMNGGFETGAVTGWIAEAHVGTLAARTGAGAPGGFTGVYCLEMRSDTGSLAAQAFYDVAVTIGVRYAYRLQYHNLEGAPIWTPSDGFVLPKSQAALWVGTPAARELYDAPLLHVTGQWITVTGSFVATDSVARLTLSSFYTVIFAPRGTFFDDVEILAAPLPLLGDQLLNGDFETGDTTGWSTSGTIEDFFVSPGNAFEGQYRATVQGGSAAWGNIYQDIVTVVGQSYDYSATCYSVWFHEAFPSDGIHRSQSRLQVGTPASPDLYAMRLIGGPLGEDSLTWVTTGGAFVATTTLTRLMLSSQYLSTDSTPSPVPSFFDAVHLQPSGTDVGPRTLYRNEGENPVDAILYLLALFYPTTAYDTQAFATARALLNGFKFRGLLTNPGDSGTLLQRMGQQCKSLVSRNPNGEITITVLDSSRPILADFDPSNIVPDTFVRSSVPVDALYTSFDVYFDTLVGGSTSPGDYAGVASATPTSTTVPNGGALVAACLAARQLYGRDHRYTFFADFVRDINTANALLAWLVSRHAVRQDTLALTSWLDAVPLQIGQVVSVTHPVLPSSGATVEGELIAWHYQPGAMQVALTVRTLGTGLDVGMVIPAAPVAHDDVGSTFVNTSVVLDILFNDVAAMGAMLNPASVDLNPVAFGPQTTVTDPGHGTFVVASSGLVTFTPVTEYVGTAVASYTVQDNFGSVSNIALITVTIHRTILALTTEDALVALALHLGASMGHTVLALTTQDVTLALAAHKAQTALAMTTEAVTVALEVHTTGSGGGPAAATCGWTFFQVIPEPADAITDTGLHILNGFEAFYDPVAAATFAVSVTGDPRAPGGTGTVSTPGLNDIYLASRLLVAPMHASDADGFTRNSLNGYPHTAASGNKLTAMVAVQSYGGLLYVAFNTAASGAETVNAAPVLFRLANLTDWTLDSFVGTWVEAHNFGAGYSRVGAMVVHAGLLYVALEPKVPGTDPLDIWTYNGTTWSLYASYDFGLSDLRAFCVFNGELYAGVNAGTSGQLLTVTGPNALSGIAYAGRIDGLLVRNGLLYINERTSAARNIWTSANGIFPRTLLHTFTTETALLTGCMALAPGTQSPALDGALDGMLYVSLRAGDGHTQVWLYDGATWTLSMDFGAGFLGVSAMRLMPDGRLYAAFSRHLHTVSPPSTVASAEIWYWSCYFPPMWALTYDHTVVDFTSAMTANVPPPPDADIDYTTLTFDALVFPALNLTLTIASTGVITGHRTATSVGGPFSTTYHFTDSLARAWSGTFQITFTTG